MIALASKGLDPMQKPSGERFYACAAGRLQARWESTTASTRRYAPQNSPFSHYLSRARPEVSEINCSFAGEKAQTDNQCEDKANLFILQLPDIMPVNKNAQFRYQILDRCFSDFRHKYSFEDLLEKVNDYLADINGSASVIKARQLRDDINAIRKMLPNGIYLDAHPYYDKKCYYRYSERDFSIYQNELSVDDVQKLRSTIDMLSRYRGVPNYAWLEGVISNLEFRFGIKSNAENVVSFEQNEQLVGLEYLSKVIEATVNHIPLIISYKTYRGIETTTTFHPYHVKQYNNRWFLFGYEEATGKIANKALDRIQRITIANVPFRPNTTIDFAHFFDDIVGVSIPSEDVKKETFVLRLTPTRFPYVTSKPIHHSQSVLSADECTIRLEAKPTRELKQQILSFGADVEVISPAFFRHQIEEEITALCKKYSAMQIDCTDSSDLCTVETKNTLNAN